MAPQPQREKPPDEEQFSDNLSERTRSVVAWAAAVGSLFIMTCFFCLTIFFYSRNPDIVTEIARTHVRGLIGPPMAAMTAISVVTLLRVTSGSLEFEAFGFKFKGASGPVVLWVLTFLACVAGIVALW